MIYYIWLVLSLILSLYGTTVYWPDYTLDHEFILFNDFATVVIFTPSLFILNSIILQGAFFLTHNLLKISLPLAAYIASAVLFYKITADLWPSGMVIVMIFLGSLVALLHLIISVGICRRG
ncbi:hypothetical protein EBB07_18420 [Paenibacillaceae bacterium]|nr:hypothetical protein EBB07_18420 [Paenibacillaceae bacterium]